MKTKISPSVPPLRRDASLRFAEREVRLMKSRVKRALKHHDSLGAFPIPSLRELSRESVDTALCQYRTAIGKRAFEIRQLMIGV